ncbi:hypothetical protein BJY24_000690 [Nocardia transvalensis]|uniref:DUF1579 domain-containing protein n=1 Tax=Nocardia transvalensis TaxID=37333 RepID=A0A7W9UG22_9NOCA|nr:DUF1579 family protein [Nocardia transvalensis]MBB5911823.1 hypothetical protein [Nocardia transvalensis]
MRSNRFRMLPIAVAALALFAGGCSGETKSEPAPASSAPAVAPDQQDAGHRRLNQLVGEWDGDKSTFIAGGTADNPVRSRIVSRWGWITETGGNFLREEAEGNFGGKPYYRLGLLGYAPTDDRYEWTTVDSVTPMTMTYKGAKGSGGQADIVTAGEFTDPGVLGPQFVGQTIAMRTRIALTSPDRVTMEIYFTPPGQAELLADRVELTRRK